MNQRISEIVSYLRESRGFDFSGYRYSMLERRIQKRVIATHSKTFESYLVYLKQTSEELDALVDVCTINVSHFFRNSLSFEYIRKVLLPNILQEKENQNDDGFRIWSAGCSFGEEPYSLAILINEYMRKENIDIKPSIFATDIDRKALKKAMDAVYPLQSLKNVKIEQFHKYFTPKGEYFELDSHIKKMVHFSFYDMLDQSFLVPPDSIFGNFDLVICKNVLIYFETAYQEIIFNKLIKSIKPRGYLVLGEAEIPINEVKNHLKRVSNCCKIFQKVD